MKLCDFKTSHQNFQLLYRGSRDGFETSSFHSRCDNKSNTITIIQTTKGWIFGGYTQASWSSSTNLYVPDSNAYLFSLVNKLNRSFVSKISNTNNAIFCNSPYGPTFGSGHDIYVCNNSDMLENSFVGLSSYNKPDGVSDPSGYYFCEARNFQVNDIEVFQITLK